jgi:methyl-accepting chemotaxis protein
MAFGLFRKRLPESAAPAIGSAAAKPALVGDIPAPAESDSAKDWSGFRTAYKL